MSLPPELIDSNLNLIQGSGGGEGEGHNKEITLDFDQTEYIG